MGGGSGSQDLGMGSQLDPQGGGEQGLTDLSAHQGGLPCEGAAAQPQVAAFV